MKLSPQAQKQISLIAAKEAAKRALSTKASVKASVKDGDMAKAADAVETETDEATEMLKCPECGHTGPEAEFEQAGE